MRRRPETPFHSSFVFRAENTAFAALLDFHLLERLEILFDLVPLKADLDICAG